MAILDSHNHLHFGQNPNLKLLFPGAEDACIPPFQANSSKDLGFISKVVLSSPF